MLSVRDARLVAREALVGVEVWPVDHVVSECAPVLLGEDGEAEEAPVAGRKGAVGAEMRVSHPGSRRDLVPMPPLVREVAEPVDHRVEEGDRDALALAGLCAARERGGRGNGGIAPGPHVADRDPDARRLLGSAGD